MSSPTAPVFGSDGEAHRYPSGRLPESLRIPDIYARQARLAQVITTEIVPRLVMAHQNARSESVHTEPPFTTDEVAEFGALAMSADGVAARGYFVKMRARGHSLDTLFVHLLAPTARHLGDLWDRDLCDFVDVTLGVARLQELLSQFGAADDIPVADHHHHAFLVSMTGEQHLFGVNMVAKLMRGAGWEVRIGNSLGAPDIGAAVARAWYGVIGVTLSASAGLDEVARAIEAARHRSRNRKIGVMVGGPAFASNAGLAVRVGADAVAEDAPAAVILAKKLLLSQFARRK